MKINCRHRLPTVAVAACFACIFSRLELPQKVALAETEKGVWRQRGFEDFIGGTFEGAGQNLYVSRKGVLQRIYQYDANRDGYLDLVFCNAQNHWEKPPAYVYADSLGKPKRVDLPSDGSKAGAVADLNGDGYDDVVLGMWYNGVRRDLNAFVYYGSPQGCSERRHLRLPAPQCISVAVGDFNGDKKSDLAFLLPNALRVFHQSELGFEQRRFKDLPIEGLQITADDPDGDGFADLVVRNEAGDLHVYWGGPGGLDPKRTSRLAAKDYKAGPLTHTRDGQEGYAEYVADATPLPKVVRLEGVPHLFMVRPGAVFLVPVTADRKFAKPLSLPCPRAMAVASGDVNGDGHPDLALACRQPHEGKERSWIYWGDGRGYAQERRTPLESYRACDVALGDLDGDGCDEVVLCQCHTAESFTTLSPVYRGSRDGRIARAAELQSEDARRVFIARSSPDKRPQVVLVNHMARGKLGNPDAFIYLGAADGYNPKRRINVASWGSIEAILADFRDSGRVDLLLANCSENSISRDPGSYVFFAGPKGLPHQPSLKLPTTRAHGVCCNDLNRDGHLDLVFCGFDNPDLLFFHGTPEGFNAKDPKRIRLECDGQVYKDPRWIYLADLNNDGRLDMVVPMIVDDRSIILWGTPDGFSMENRQVLSVERAACARAADLDGNGYLDLIFGGHNVTPGVPHDSFVYVYWNGPEGLRQDRLSMLPSAGINSMAVADFNKDGTLDVFVGSYHEATTRDTDSYIYWNRKGKGFSATDRDRLFTHSASGCVAADFNEDGWIDLAIAYHKVWGDHTGWSAVWWNGPEGFDEKRITRLPTFGPHGMMPTPGNQWDRGPEEYYQSSPFKLPDGAAAAGISWQAQIPPKTWVKAQLRFADSKGQLPNAPWTGPDGKGSWYDDRQPVKGATSAGKWVQYRLALGALSGLSTPRVTEVNVQYNPRDEP